MHDFTMHGENGGETDDAAFGGCDAADATCNFLFADTWSAKAHGSSVHFIANGTCAFDFCHFFG